MKTTNFADLWDELLAEGRSNFTVTDLQQRTGATLDAVYSAVKYATDRRRLLSPVRGLYVVVPPEHRVQGVVPAVQFIDPMMRHLDINYYVAHGAAAQWWGAAHQATQVFDVTAARHVHDRDLDGVRLRFHASTRIDHDAVRRVAGPRTMLNVASPELTAVDLASRPRLNGGLSHVATILAELPDLNSAQLADLASRRARADTRRLGWLLEHVRDDLLLDALHEIARADQGRPTLLAANDTREGHHNTRWAVIVNTTVEPDEL